jgi:hypothetical protein
MDGLLELHFSGQDISPDSIRIGEIATILDAFENVLLSIIAQDHPTLTKDALTIGLHRVNEGSLGLQFTSRLPEVVTPAFHQAAQSIHLGAGDHLPPNAISDFEKILSFVKRHQAQADFIVINGRAETLATLTPDYELPKPAFLIGQTTVYGEIVRVGGVEPKVEVKLISGATIYCPFDISLASLLGSLLYKLVGLEGEARWDPRTHEIDDFRVIGVSPFRDGSVVEAFQSLSNIAGKYYDDVDNVTEYIAELRGEE